MARRFIVHETWPSGRRGNSWYLSGFNKPQKEIRQSPSQTHTTSYQQSPVLHFTYKACLNYKSSSNNNNYICLTRLHKARQTTINQPILTQLSIYVWPRYTLTLLFWTACISLNISWFNNRWAKGANSVEGMLTKTPQSTSHFFLDIWTLQHPEQDTYSISHGIE